MSLVIVFFHTKHSQLKRMMEYASDGIKLRKRMMEYAYGASQNSYDA